MKPSDMKRMLAHCLDLEEQLYDLVIGLLEEIYGGDQGAKEYAVSDFKEQYENFHENQSLPCAHWFQFRIGEYKRRLEDVKQRQDEEAQRQLERERLEI